MDVDHDDKTTELQSCDALSSSTSSEHTSTSVGSPIDVVSATSCLAQ